MSAVALVEKAVLVHVCVSQWSGRKLDKNASDDLTTMKRAQKDVARVYKDLVKSDNLDKFRKCGGRARGLMYEMTLPWLDGGTRVCPNGMLAEFKRRLRDIIEEANDHANAFAKEYDMIDQKNRQQLGDLYNQLDYPRASTIRQRFSIQPTYLPIPYNKDFRVEGQEDYLDGLAKAVDIEVYRRLAKSAERLLRCVGKEDGRVTNKLTDHLQDLIDSLPKLNITENPEVVKIAMALKKQFSGVTREALKDDAKVRKDAVAFATKLKSDSRKHLDKMGVDPDETDDEPEDKPAPKKAEAKPKAEKAEKKPEVKKVPVEFKAQGTKKTEVKKTEPKGEVVDFKAAAAKKSKRA